MLISDIDLQKLILEKHLLSQKQLKFALDQSQDSQGSLLNTLIKKELVPETELYCEIAKDIHLPFIRLNSKSVSASALRIIPESIAKKRRVVIFQKDNNSIKLASADPSHDELISNIEKKTNKKVQKFLTTPSDIKKSLLLYRVSLQKMIEDILSNKSDTPFENVPVVKIVELLIEYAYQDRASDIHIEPTENYILIRFRIDSLLHDILTLPKDLGERIVNRIKILSKILTDEHRIPQDGKFRFPLEEENLDIRVSVIPVADGEKVVLRLLTSKGREYSLTNLGLSETDLEKITKSLEKPHGMILSTGPTGSGKTTTIYALIKAINKREHNIMTIEDPIEYRIKGINQVQVNPKANLTFVNGLGSILRQDPNVIFVGEIRDSQTAAITVNAGLTGHLVLSTTHTNTSVGTLPRLAGMGIESVLLASTVNIVIAQRLLRKICNECKTPYDISANELAKILPMKSLNKKFIRGGKIKLFKGTGCPNCHNTGFLGRIGIFEVLPITKKIRESIIKGSDSDQIFELAIQEGMTTMFEDGFQKVIAGLTTIEEILRVTKEESL